MSDGNFIPASRNGLQYEWFDNTYISIDYYNIDHKPGKCILTKNIYCSDKTTGRNKIFSLIVLQI